MGDVAVIAGSRIRVGFAYKWANVYYPNMPDQLNNPQDAVLYVQNALASWFSGGGGFTNPEISVTAPGWFSDGYILIKASTMATFLSRADIQNTAAAVISQLLPFVLVTRKDDVQIDYVPSPSQPATPPGAVNPPSDSGLSFTVGTDTPDVTGTQRTYVPPLLPSEEQAQTNLLWVLGAGALVAVIFLAKR